MRGIFKINEAVARAIDMGVKTSKKELAAKLFAGTTPEAQQVNMSNLCSGRTKRIAPEWVSIICEECKCTPNYLFGY